MSDVSHDEHEDNRVHQIATKSGLIQLLGRAGAEQIAPQITNPIAIPVGQPITFKDASGKAQRGIVCAPDDPRRGGTYTSARHGEIPVMFDTRNRKQRRAAAKAR